MYHKKNHEKLEEIHVKKKEEKLEKYPKQLY